jgi:protein-S-isoprenylcysteine O-methyltransferase Ste14
MMKLKPLVYVLLAILLMLALHWLAPIARILVSPWKFPGAIPLLCGAGLVLHGLRLFRHQQTTAKPFGDPSRLVIDGAYRFTRNPMCLGFLLILSGIAGLLGTLSPWIIVPALGLVLDRLFIRPEEAKMTALFGDAYRRYQSQVRRWL